VIAAHVALPRAVELIESKDAGVVRLAASDTEQATPMLLPSGRRTTLLRLSCLGVALTIAGRMRGGASRPVGYEAEPRNQVVGWDLLGRRHGNRSTRHVSS
jgi:hypothetical protein